jgi:hypothetical protein
MLECHVEKRRRQTERAVATKLALLEFDHHDWLIFGGAFGLVAVAVGVSWQHSKELHFW